MRSITRLCVAGLALCAVSAVTSSVASCSSSNSAGGSMDGGSDVSQADSSKDATATDSGGGDAGADAAGGLAKINHLVIFYMENHSFDNLYGEFPSADGLSSVDAAAPNVVQVDGTGTPYATLPQIDGGAI